MNGLAHNQCCACHVDRDLELSPKFERAFSLEAQLLGDGKAKIKAFISRFVREREIEDNADIFELGFVNSLIAMQLVLFVEKEFSISIENDDLDLENFKSVNAIADLIDRKRANSSASNLL